MEHVTPWTIQRAAEFCELPEGKIKEAIDAYIDASPHACFTRGQKVEFSINTSGISQAFTIMMALAGNFDSKGGQNIGREPATGQRRTPAAAPPPATTPSCSTSCRTRKAAWGSAARKRP